MENTLQLLQRVATLSIIIGVNLLALSIGPAIENEIWYYTHTPRNTGVLSSQTLVEPRPSIAPIDTSFGIVIPKIEANAHISDNVDPYNEYEYQQALAKGVAHAKGTAEPGQAGNLFLFSHSAADAWFATKYNSIFYLLSKMDHGDKIYIFYQNKMYVYQVTDIQIVDPTETKYLLSEGSEKKITLMTCWPAGLNIKRLMVLGKLIYSEDSSPG